MNPFLLTACINIALGVTATQAHASVPVDRGTLPVARLSVLFGQDASEIPEAANEGPVLQWYTDQALLTQNGYTAAVAAYRKATPIAVLRGKQDATVDMALQGIFGVSSPAALAIYVRDADGAPHVHSLAEVPAGEQGYLPQQLVEGITASVRQAQTRTPADGAELIALPKMVYTETQYASSGNGASVTIRGEVIRDSGRSYDVLTATGKSTHNLKPHHNGKSGSSVIVPGEYQYYLSMNTPDNAGTLPKLIEFKPASSPSTDLNISEQHQTTTSYGFGLSREVSAGLQGPVPQFGAKAAFSFDFSRSYTTTNQLSFSVKDYSVAANAAAPSPHGSKTYWQLPLAPAVASKPDYFGSSPDESKMTPSMRQVTAEGSAAWIVPGTYAGTMSMMAGAQITNREFTGESVDSLPDPRPQPTAGISIRADSPYLTREVTVFIQSKAGNGGCLRDQDGVVRISQCPDTAHANWLNDLHAQWQLDTHGRYYNRGSKKCMQILTSGLAPGGRGEIIMAPCSVNRDQRWEWQSDRIHSLHGDGYPEWRMFVGPGDVIGIRTDGKPEYQSIPANPFHALLNPWSSYPRAPGSADFIPKLENIGPNPPISEEMKRLGAPLPQERWELVVLRQSLHR